MSQRVSRLYLLDLSVVLILGAIVLSCTKSYSQPRHHSDVLCAMMYSSLAPMQRPYADLATMGDNMARLSVWDIMGFSLTNGPEVSPKAASSWSGDRLPSRIKAAGRLRYVAEEFSKGSDHPEKISEGVMVEIRGEPDVREFLSVFSETMSPKKGAFYKYPRLSKFKDNFMVCGGATMLAGFTCFLPLNILFPGTPVGYVAMKIGLRGSSQWDTKIMSSLDRMNEVMQKRSGWTYHSIDIRTDFAQEWWNYADRIDERTGEIDEFVQRMGPKKDTLFFYAKLLQFFASAYNYRTPPSESLWREAIPYFGKRVHPGSSRVSMDILGFYAQDDHEPAIRIWLRHQLGPRPLWEDQ